MSPCVRIEGPSIDVLYKCLDLLGSGYNLYTYPVAGNARLLHNPYRTVIMRRVEPESSRKTGRDIRIISHFLCRMESFEGEAPAHTHGDYQLVDYDLYLSMRPDGE